MNFFDNNYNDYIKTFISGKFNIDVNKLLLTRDYNINPYEYSKMIKPLLTNNVIRNMQEKNLFFVADMSYESEYFLIDFLLNEIVISYDLPIDQFIFIVSSKDVHTYTIKKCEKIGISSPLIVNLMFFERNMKIRLLLDFLDDDGSVDNLFNQHDSSPISLYTGLYKNTSKKYINLNRVWKPHRVALMTILESEKLLQYGYNSFPEKSWFHKNEKYRTEDEIWIENLNQSTKKYKTLENLIIQGQTLRSKLPLVLDQSNFRINHALSSHRTLLKYFNDSWFSIISETNYLSSQPKFLTEKTFKAISFKHPFILNSTPYSLDFLKDLGYKTFENIIDEQYDKEEDDDKRMMLLINEIKRLCNLSQTELIDFKCKAIPIVEHNFKHFMSTKIYFDRI